MDLGEYASNRPCFFCAKGKDGINYYYDEDIIMQCECKYCGSYKINHDAVAELKRNRDDAFFNKARSIAATRKLQGRENYTLSRNNDLFTIMIGDNIFLDEYPSDFFEKVSKVLWNIGKLTNFDPTKGVDFDNNNFQYLFCDDPLSASELIDFLYNEKYISTKSFYSRDVFSAADVHLTMAGLRKIEKRDDCEQCFIAMWFDDSMKIYAEAVKRAIINAGYRPYIANEDLHNDQIMPRVLNEIRNSRFVIADLTSNVLTPDKDKSGVRGGVYYEAGYAKGLGLPVILTCDKNAVPRIHFDLRQVMCYYWTEANGILKIGDQKFEDVITQNILLNVGLGPCKGALRCAK